jgi:hypothetical protein
MKSLILGSVAIAALALSVGAASAQSQRDGDGAVTLTPEQRAVVRDVVRDELEDRLGNRIADRLSQLSPSQREALRSALKQRLTSEVREGLSDRISDRLGAGSGIVSERVSGEMRDPGAEQHAVAGSGSTPIGDLSNNEGIFVSKTTFKILKGASKGDPQAQITKLGARPVTEGVIVFRTGDQLYITDAVPGGAQMYLTYEGGFGSSGWWEQMDREGRGGR